MGLVQKLQNMCEKAEQFASKEMSSSTKEIGRLVSEVIKNGSWEYLPSKMEKSLNENIDAAQYAANLADAAEFIIKKVIEPEYSRVKDLKISGNIHEAQEQIRELFVTRQVPNRGFVYVAWSAKPERFMYVGKAGSANRLSLVAHGKLAHATAHVSTLSLIFPSQSSEKALNGIEASIIRVVDYATGESPENNAREEAVPLGGSASQLMSLADFLLDVAKKVHPLS